MATRVNNAEGLLLLQEQIKHFKRTGQRAAPNEKVD